MSKTYPKDWLSRRIHSLLGLWLILYLIEHLLTNSQAALWIGDEGSGFIHMVNSIHRIPYLQVVEICLIGLPLLFHAWWGVKYIFTAKSNAYSRGTNHPKLSKYGRNHAYSWQRYTAWILLIGIILHVIQMRFVDYPQTVVVGSTDRIFVVKVSMDRGLYGVVDRMGGAILDKQAVLEQQALFQERQANTPPAPMGGESRYSPLLGQAVAKEQALEVDRRWVEVISNRKLKANQVLVAVDEFGKAVLLNVRATFKDPWMLALYTIFVLAAVYHAFRGLWSAMIVWGVSLTRRSQTVVSKVAVGFMVVLGFFGLAAVWLTYWVNLRS